MGIPVGSVFIGVGIVVRSPGPLLKHPRFVKSRKMKRNCSTSTHTPSPNSVGKPVGKDVGNSVG